MGTMNFSIPDDVKDAFDAAFKDDNKNAIVADLLRMAVEEKRSAAKNDDDLDALIEELLRQRAEDPPMSDDEIRRIRHEGRP